MNLSYMKETMMFIHNCPLGHIHTKVTEKKMFFIVFHNRYSVNKAKRIK